MTGAAEMRRVIAHATEGLRAAAEHQQAKAHADLQISIPIAYAVGVLDLLGTYLIDIEPSGGAVPAADLSLRLLDREGDLWAPDDGSPEWTCVARGSDDKHSGVIGGQEASRAAVVKAYGPVVEVWVR